MTTWTWMRHGETGGVQRFAAAAVEEWRKAGWEPCDPPAARNLALDPAHPALNAFDSTQPEQPAQSASTKTRRASATDKEE